MFSVIIVLTTLILSLMKGISGNEEKSGKFFNYPCTVEDDCVVANCIGVDGYRPNCVCDCKPGWEGNTCNTFNEGQIRKVKYPEFGYSSEFAISTKNSGTYKNATKRCQSFGDGWDIATALTYEASQAAGSLAFFHDDSWLGGSDAAIPGTWVWQAGRLKNKAFFINGTPVIGMYEGFTNDPTDQKCNNHTKHWMASDTMDYNWSNRFDESPGSSCDVVPNCVICERSACVKEIDCVVANTKNVSGYYPCVCTCLLGYYGNNCSVKITNSTQKDYTSEFIVLCNYTDSYSSAVNRCHSYMDGWDIATVPGGDANAAIKSLLTKDAWFGGRVNKLNTTNWMWDGGRLKGKSFWNTSSNTCDTGMYCNWGTAQPNISKCGTSDRNVTVMQPSGKWISSIDGKDAQCVGVPSCVICERSLCNTIYDCPDNVSYKLISGYFPNCRCECIPGWNGTKCDVKYNLSRVKVNDTVSEFYIYCQPDLMPLTQAVQECEKYGHGWEIASVPNADANDAIAGLALKLPSTYTSPDIEIWAGGTDEGQLYKWKWMEGRLKNKIFTPDRAPKGGNSTCLPGMYCNWKSGAPDDSEPWVAHQTGLAIYKKDGYNFTWEDIIASKTTQNVLPKCVACERSPCVIRDACNVTNAKSVTGYFPLCKCQCKSGYVGQSCNGRVCDISIDCSNNTISINGTYPNCICNCKPKWFGTKCDSRECVMKIDCSNNTLFVNGSYPDCKCHCKPGWEGKFCDTIIKTTPIVPTKTLFPTPTMPTTTNSTTLSPGLPKCPFRGVYPCGCMNSSFNVKRGGVLWPAILDLGSLKSVGYAVVTLSVLKNMTLKIKLNETELLSKSVTEGETSPDIPYRREDGAAFFVNSIGVLGDRMFITFNETFPGSVSKKKKTIPPNLILRFKSSSLINDCCNGTLTRKLELDNAMYYASLAAIDVGKITISTVPNTSVDNRAISNDAKAAINVAKTDEISCKKALLGTSWVELTAAAPLGRLLPIDAPYYVRAMAANIILVLVVTVVHIVIVFMLSIRDSTRTFTEWCAKARFPSVTIGCLFAVSPGTAIAAGGLLGTWSGTTEGCDVYSSSNDSLAQFLAIIGALIIILTFAFTLAFSQIWMRRSFLPVPLLPGISRTRVEMLLPATVVLPLLQSDMFHSLVGTIRLSGLIWPSTPMWSSIILFIFAAIYSNSNSVAALSLIVAIIHAVIIICVFAIRPFCALSLNIMHCLGLLPITFLVLVQGILLIQNSSATTGDNSAVIVFSYLATFAAIIRLLLYIVQPFPCFFLLYSISNKLSSSFTDSNYNNNFEQMLLNHRDGDKSIRLTDHKNDQNEKFQQKNSIFQNQNESNNDSVDDLI